MAVLVGLLIVAIYLIAFYRGLGVISVTALGVFASIYLGISGDALSVRSVRPFAAGHRRYRTHHRPGGRQFDSHQ